MGTEKARDWAHQQRGLSLLEGLIMVGLLMFVMALVVPHAIRQTDDMVNVLVADHQRLMVDKFRQYIKDNYAAVLAVASPTTPAVITVPMLKNLGYLDAGIEEANTFGQVPRAYARKAATSRLETVIVNSGGTPIPEGDLRRIAMRQGIEGGFVSSEAPTIAQGARGAWRLALSNFGVAPGPGYLASALVFEDGAPVDDYLYRNAVPGHPELNEMNTALGMRNNDVNAVRNLTASAKVAAGSVSTVDDVTVGRNAAVAGETTTGGWFRTTGDSGWYSNKWGGGWYMSDPTWVRAYGNKNVYTGGELRGGAVTADGRLRTGEYLQLDGVASEGGGCSPNGLVGRNTQGLILSCQSGVWTLNGRSTIERHVWYATENEDYRDAYGDMCNADLWARGWGQQGWVVTGADACSEDGKQCTSDGVLCFAIRLR